MDLRKDNIMIIKIALAFRCVLDLQMVNVARVLVRLHSPAERLSGRVGSAFADGIFFISFT
jgi:hypothetical protein